MPNKILCIKEEWVTPQERGKRLGFLLETYEVDKSIEFLTDFIKDSKSYALLDPTLPNQGKYYKHWRLRINIEPKELKTIIKT